MQSCNCGNEDIGRETKERNMNVATAQCHDPGFGPFPVWGPSPKGEKVEAQVAKRHPWV